MRRPWLNRLVLPAGVLLAYFLVPVSEQNAPVGVVLGAALAVAGLAAVFWTVLDEVRHARKRLQLVHLLLALELVVVIFSLGYYVLQVQQPGQFAGLNTRLDALYFSLTTMATVGYGDIHAMGQLARGIVSVQLVFNLAFVAAVVGLFQDRIRSRGPGAPAKDADATG